MSNTKNRKQEVVRIGARALEKTDAQNILPDYEKMTRQIDDFREVAQSVNEQNNDNRFINDDSQYDNVISILGDRGMGKTSILYTLKKYINVQKGQCGDIVLPVINPDSIENENDVLSWIISYLDNEKDNLLRESNWMIEERLKDDRYRKWSKEDEDKERKELKFGMKELDGAYNKLRSSYIGRQSSYKQLLPNVEYYGNVEYFEEYEKTLKNDRELIKDFKNFVNQLVKTKRDLKNGTRKNNDEVDAEVNDEKHIDEPLIFIFFDDVDISAKRCPEVLEVIMKFLSHQSIVTVVSGNYTIFSDMMTIHFLKDEDILCKDLFDENYTSDQIRKMEEEITSDERFFDAGSNHIGISNNDSSENRAVRIKNVWPIKKSAKKLRMDRSHEFLKKVLPPSFRYELNKLSDRQIENFRYDSNNGDELAKMNIFELLENILYEESNRTKSFLRYGSDILYLYMDILDKSPRGLINVYYFLYSKAKHIKDKEKDNKENNKLAYGLNDNEMENFLDIIIESNFEFRDFKDIIKRFISHKTYMSWRISYDYLKSEWNNMSFGDITKEDSKNIFLKICVLGIFFSSMINVKSTTDKDKKLYLDRVKALVDIINRDFNSENRLLPSIGEVDDVKKYLTLYDKLTKGFMAHSLERIFKDKYIKLGNQSTHYLEREHSYFMLLESIYEKSALPPHKYDKLSEDEKIARNQEVMGELIEYFNALYNYDFDWVKEKVDFVFRYGSSYDEDARLVFDDAISTLRKYLGNRFSLRLRNVSKDIEKIIDSVKISKTFDEIKKYLKNKYLVEIKSLTGKSNVKEKLSDYGMVINRFTEYKTNTNSINYFNGIIRNIDNIANITDMYYSKAGKSNSVNKVFELLMSIGDGEVRRFNISKSEGTKSEDGISEYSYQYPDEGSIYEFLTGLNNYIDRTINENNMKIEGFNQTKEASEIKEFSYVRNLELDDIRKRIERAAILEIYNGTTKEIEPPVSSIIGAIESSMKQEEETVVDDKFWYIEFELEKGFENDGSDYSQFIQNYFADNKSKGYLVSEDKNVDNNTKEALKTYFVAAERNIAIKQVKELVSSAIKLFDVKAVKKELENKKNIIMQKIKDKKLIKDDILRVYSFFENIEDIGTYSLMLNLLCRDVKEDKEIVKNVFDIVYILIEKVRYLIGEYNKNFDSITNEQKYSIKASFDLEFHAKIDSLEFDSVDDFFNEIAAVINRVGTDVYMDIYSSLETTVSRLNSTGTLSNIKWLKIEIDECINDLNNLLYIYVFSKIYYELIVINGYDTKDYFVELKKLLIGKAQKSAPIGFYLYVINQVHGGTLNV
jgi:hypothetical protein